MCQRGLAFVCMPVPLTRAAIPFSLAGDDKDLAKKWSEQDGINSIHSLYVHNTHKISVKQTTATQLTEK